MNIKNFPAKWNSKPGRFFPSKMIAFISFCDKKKSEWIKILKALTNENTHITNEPTKKIINLNLSIYEEKPVSESFLLWISRTGFLHFVINKISMYNIVVLLFCGFVVLWFSDFVECISNAINKTTKQPDNKTTRQQNNQTTLTYFYLLIFYFYLWVHYKKWL